MYARVCVCVSVIVLKMASMMHDPFNSDFVSFSFFDIDQELKVRDYVCKCDVVYTPTS